MCLVCMLTSKRGSNGYGGQADFLLRDNTASARVVSSGTQKGWKCNSWLGSCGPRGNSAFFFFFFKYKGEWILGDNWQCLQHLEYRARRETQNEAGKRGRMRSHPPSEVK